MKSRQLLALLIVFILYGALAYSGYRIFLMALLLVLLLILSAWAQLIWVRSRIQVTQNLPGDPVYTGDKACIDVRVENRSRWPVAALEIEIRQYRQDQMPPPDPAPPTEGGPLRRLRARLAWQIAHVRRPTVKPLMIRKRTLSVFGRSSLQEQIPLLSEDARIYSVGIVRMRLRDPFGLIQLRLPARGAQQMSSLRLHVLPRPHEQLTFEALNQIRLVGLHASPRQSDEINAIDDLRVMRPGDSLKRIHWIVSAKQNQWMIKTFEKEEQGNVLIVPDLVNENLPDRLHRKRRKAILSVTAAALEKMLAGDLSLLMATSGEQLQFGRADRQDQLLDLFIQLAAAPDQPRESLDRVVPEGLTYLPDDATVVIVSARPDDMMIQLSSDLITSGHPVFLIYYQNPAESSDEPLDWFARIQAVGAGLIKVYEHERSN